MAFRFGKLDNDAGAVAGLLVSSFNTPPESAARWVAASGADNFRLLRSGRSAIGCVLRVPMGQWFGGRSVPMVGIAGVAIAVHERGRGAALQMMKATMTELAAEGVPLSTLFASTQGLYRQVGFELAGHRIGYELDLHKLGLVVAPAEEGRLTVRPFASRHRAAVHALHREIGKRGNGVLDRGEYVWRRVEAPRGQAADGFGVWAGDALEGYVFLGRTSAGDVPYYSLRLTDLAATTPRALRRLLRLLRDHTTLADRAIVHDGPAPAFLSMLAERAHRIDNALPFMVRVLDVKRALEARGYGAGVRGSVALSIHDDLIPQNDGRFVLEVAAGRGKVRRGGTGRLELDVRALAPLYTGYLSAGQLRDLGWLRGSDRDTSLASSVFAGSPPGMGDMF